ncbi:Alkaline phosphatase synthesis sensor protein PhoR [bioreactor metagenome]|uniref:histidine kinase n=1 Tax=bioreactor metagenome TaxID=1076179 RepID=A0A645J2B2_9ZZZZ
MLINLLDNSLKFTPSGGRITMAARLGAANGNKQKDSVYEIIVEDSGYGIDRDELPVIKNRFYRGENSGKERESGGLGLGLSICEELVKAHGGSIDILSEVEKGTKVIIRLPLNTH